MSKRLEDLEVWKLSREFNKKIYPLIRNSSSIEQRLRNQILSSAGSIMDNIAEGYERDGNREFIQFLSIAKGSCGECKSQLYRCADWEIIPQKECEMMIRDLDTISK